MNKRNNGILNFIEKLNFDGVKKFWKVLPSIWQLL